MSGLTVTALGEISVQDNFQFIEADVRDYPCLIYLPSIKSRESFVDRKFYVNDYYENAGTNNITLIAPEGCRINGQQQITLGQNGISVLITISGIKDYLAIYSIVNIPNSPFKTYKAAFSLPNPSGNPIANILQNDLGFIPNWTRDSVGSYSTTSTFWFGKANKVFISTTKSWLGTGYINCSISEEDSGIVLLTYDKNGVLTDGLLADTDSFSRSYIEINVFD